MAKDYASHAKALDKEINSLNKKALLRVLRDAIKYPLEESKNLVGEEEISIASKLRAIQDIKGRMTINYLMLEGQQIKEKQND